MASIKFLVAELKQGSEGSQGRPGHWGGELKALRVSAFCMAQKYFSVSTTAVPICSG